MDEMNQSPEDMADMEMPFDMAQMATGGFSVEVSG